MFSPESRIPFPVTYCWLSPKSNLLSSNTFPEISLSTLDIFKFTPFASSESSSYWNDPEPAFEFPGAESQSTNPPSVVEYFVISA